MGNSVGQPHQLGGATPEMEKFLERISLASPAPPRKKNKLLNQQPPGSGKNPGGEIPGRKVLPRQGQCL